MSKRFSSLIIILLLFMVATTLSAAPPPYLDTTENGTSEEARQAALYESDVIMVKFDDAHRLRLRDGELVEVTAEGRPAAQSPALQQLRSSTAEGEWERAHTVSEANLDAMRVRGERNTGQALPDLNNRYRYHLPPGTDATTAVAELAQNPLVYKTFLIPKPIPAALDFDYSSPGGVTGNPVVDPYQGYLDAAPDGIDVRYAWSVGNTAQGINICDVEYDFNHNHADLPTITFVGEPADPPFGDDHGTAVLGMLAGRNNGFGVKGMAHGGFFFFAAAKTTTDGYDVGAGIIECADNLNAGDVILIEQQTAGPNYVPNDDGDQFGLVPVEWYEPWYDDIVTAVSQNIIVVEAGGNGSQDLDDDDYETGNGGHYPFQPANDSGAIIVGAGKSPNWGSNARSAYDFSNYGSTVDLQGWGGDILTTGYGVLYSAEGKNLWYTDSFGGTSGASPMVTAAVALTQRTHKQANGGTPATPSEMKTILRTTGTAQVGSKNIGPLPNLQAALQSLSGVQTVNPPVITPDSGTYNMPLEVTIDYGAGQSGGDTNIRYTLDGSEPTPDSFIFIPEQGDTLYLNYGVTVKAKAFQFDASAGVTVSSDTTTVTYQSSTPKVATPVITPGGGSYSQGQQFTLSTSTPGATIRYRTDGRAPSFFYPGTTYSGPITLPPGSYEIVARGYKDGYYKSDAAYSGDIIINEITLPSPTIYPGTGTYNGQVTAYLGSTVLGAEIRYTTNGSDPTASSPLFSEPFVFTADTTLKARVYLDGYSPSDVVTAEYTIIGQASAPVLTPNGGTATDSVQVSMSTANSDGVIRYTTNGAEPTSYSTVYEAPITLNVGQHTVKAKTFVPGAQASETTTAVFTVYSSAPTVQAPEIDPPGGNYNGPITVTMSSDTEDIDFIYYTLDGTDPAGPGADFKIYNGPFLLYGSPDTYFLRARAWKTGEGASDLSPIASLTVVTPTLGTVDAPTFNVPGGTYTNTFTLQISAPDHNPPFRVRRLFVTTDGTTPVADFSPDGGGSSTPRNLSIFQPQTVQAISAQVGWVESAVTTAEYTFVCDTPTISPEGGTFTSDEVLVTMSTGTNNATIRYTLDGSEPTDSSPVYSTALTISEGTTVKAKCFRTNFDPSETVTEVYNFTAPPEAPQIISQPQSETVTAGDTAVFSVQATGVPTPTYQWQFAGADLAGEVEPTLEIPAAQAGNEGTYRVIVSNSEGEVTSNEVTLTVQEEALAGLTASNDSPTELSLPTTLTATVTQGSGTFTWDFGDGTTGSGPIATHVYPAVGTYTATVTATNSINTLTAQTIVTVEANPLVNLTAVNDSPTELGLPTTLTATVMSGDGLFTWDFGDGTTGSGPIATHVYPAVGTYTATVTATNSVNTLSTQTVVTIEANPLEGLSASNDSPTEVGLPTTLSASLASGTGTFTWDFGDGTIGSGQMVTHTYLNTGTYTATVTATNSVNSLTAQTLVTVVPEGTVPEENLYLPLIAQP